MLTDDETDDSWKHDGGVCVGEGCRCELFVLDTENDSLHAVRKRRRNQPYDRPQRARSQRAPIDEALRRRVVQVTETAD